MTRHERWWFRNRPPTGDDAMTFGGVMTTGTRAASANGLAGGADPATSEVYYDPDEAEFLRAVDRYCKEHRRRFPTAVEILDIAKALGYRRVADPSPLPKYRGGGAA